MKYKITKQYSEYAEILCAELYSLEDVIIFVHRATAINKEKNENIIYWVFEDNKLNTDITNIDVGSKKLMSRYAKNKDELPLQISSPFNVNTIINGEEVTVARFYHYDDAKLFSEEKLVDASTAYSIFDGDRFIEKIDRTTVSKDNATTEKKKVFRPTPLPNKPRLGPGGYWVDEDDLDK